MARPIDHRPYSTAGSPGAALLGAGLLCAGLLCAALLCAGCRDAPPDRAPAAAPRVEPQAAPSTAAEPTVPGTAARLAETPPPAPGQARRDRLEGMRQGLRVKHFEAQGAVPLPASIASTLGALVPAEGKLVDFEVHRRMHLLEPIDGRRVVLRWLTRRPTEAAGALARQTVAAWIGSPVADGATEAKHPRWGAVSWRVFTPEERATRVEVIVRGPDATGALTVPTFDEKPAWAEVVGAPIGYEHGRYHARDGSPAHTDLTRFSAIFATDDGPGLRTRLEAAMTAAGYEVDDDEPRLLRGPGADRTTFTTRLGEGRLTLHHQRRWRRSEAGPAIPR